MRDGPLKRAVTQALVSARSALLPKASREHLQALRLRELEIVARLLPGRGRLLEIGAGSGWQSRELARLGYDVSAIDVPESHLALDREWPVLDYDGRKIPFNDATFDIVYSSNVLEHIAHVHEFQREILRVLTQGGVAVHVVPSASWRFWTNLTHPVRYWTPPQRHGEHASGPLSEILEFRISVWRAMFRATGWRIEAVVPAGVFYTGSSIADRYVSIRNRERLARLVGGACHIFVLRKLERSPKSDRHGAN